MSYETLQRKANQAWDMAGLARQDGDAKDTEKRTKEARKYDDEIRRRNNES